MDEEDKIVEDLIKGKTKTRSELFKGCFVDDDGKFVVYSEYENCRITNSEAAGIIEGFFDLVDFDADSQSMTIVYPEEIYIHGDADQIEDDWDD
jgi:hypothetical protein